METWDWEMRDLYRAMGDLDAVCRKVEALGGGADRRVRGIRAFADPVLGINVEVSMAIFSGMTAELLQIPKCEKGRSIASALKMVAGAEARRTKTIWAETKYDGER